MRKFLRLCRKALKWGLVSVVSGIVLAVYLFLTVVNANPLLKEEEVNYFYNFNPPTSVEILDESGARLFELPGIEDWSKKIPEYRKVVTVGEISSTLIRALLAAEDRRFFEHDGVDYRAIIRAIKEIGVNTLTAMWRCGCRKIVLAQGASTITQQAVQLSLFPEEVGNTQKGLFWRTFAKVRKMQVAIWLEYELTKRYGNKELAKTRIFEVFVNLSYFGHSRYGVQTASEFYFGKSALEIDKPEEAALLAGLIRDPYHYSPRINMVASEGRRNRILGLMKDLLGDDIPADATKTAIKLAEVSKEKTVAPSAVDYILKSMWGKKGWQNGTKVRSTIRKSWQEAANQAVEGGLALYLARHPEAEGKAQAAMVVMQNNGKVRAIVGGSGVSYTSFNRAFAKLQPGSAIKPIVYAAALSFKNEQGKILRGTDCSGGKLCFVLDAPISIAMGKGKPRHSISNYDGRYYGNIPLWQCFAESRNACTLWLARNFGAGRESSQAILELAQLLGIYENAEPSPTMALGAEVVTPFDLTAAYTAFANGGYRIEPTVIEEVFGPDNNTIKRNGTSGSIRVLEPEVARDMQKLLRHAILWQKGTGRSLSNLPQWNNEEQKMKENLPFEVGGKTGTTNNFRAAWFCGSTNGLEGITACVVVVRDDNAPLTDPEKCKPLDPEGRKYCESGAVVALPIFKKFIETIYTEKLPEPFPKELNEAVLAVHKHGIVRR